MVRVLWKRIISKDIALQEALQRERRVDPRQSLDTFEERERERGGERVGRLRNAKPDRSKMHGTFERHILKYLHHWSTIPLFTDRLSDAKLIASNYVTSAAILSV